MKWKEKDEEKKNVGAKAQNHAMGLGPHTGRSTTSEEKTWVPKGLLA